MLKLNLVTFLTNNFQRREPLFLLQKVFVNLFLKNVKNKQNHLTNCLLCGIIKNGTFYFWSLQSVQRRADKCCKVHILDKDCHQAPYQPK